MNTLKITPVTGRFAPSPTGPLHTGSLVAAVGSWLMARVSGGRWLLRIDDLDHPRCRQEFEDDILRTLECFELYWDGPISRQSSNNEAYSAAFKQLQQLGAVYPCGCSRAEIASAASAPHPGQDIPYPGTCRSGLAVNKRARSWRLCTERVQIRFDDLRHGNIVTELDASGDFIIRRADGFFAYQLAVVVDDHLTGVNQVVRGDDLLDSTPRQILLHQLLDWSLPVYCHLPLVTGPEGTKLSKRNNKVSLAGGVAAGQETALLVWCLTFLGLQVPSELSGAPCRELLDWGISNFRLCPSDYSASARDRATSDILSAATGRE